MLLNRNGQAKVLTETELKQLFERGFSCSRDKALFAVAFYTGSRISEARQMHLIDAFSEGRVRDDILIRKANTKGKHATRTIPTHPKLAEILSEYYSDSLELIKVKELVGGWSTFSLNEDGLIVSNNHLQCPRCGSTQIIKHSRYKGEQCYLCKKCGRLTRESKFHKICTDAQAPSAILYNPRGIKASRNYGFLFAEENNPFLFPGQQGQGCLSLRTAIYIFDQAFERMDIVGASTHSCRRTALTMMHREGVILRVLQEISGHKDLGVLQRYLEVSEEQTRAAVNVLN
jgi:site-specific recombinase XerD